MRKARLIIRHATGIIAIGCFAASGMSNFTPLYPFGLPISQGSTAAINMGGIGAAVLNDHNIMHFNPANLGAIDKTAFSSLLSVDILQVKESSHHSYNFGFLPRQISFAFPLGKGGTVGFSLLKETDGNVKYETDPAQIANLDFYGKLSYDRTGGLTSWRVGWGHDIGKWAFVGLAYERLNFTLNSTKIAELDRYSSSRDSTNVHFTAHGIHGGLIVPVAKANFGIAGRYVFADDLDYSRGQYRSGDTTAISGTTSSGRAGVRIPPYLLFGASYDFSPRWLAGADIGYEKWSSYTSHGYLPPSDIDYAFRFGTGMRFIPAPDLLAPKYWETIHYRLGFKFWQLPHDGSSELAFSLGSGFPVKGGGLIDLVVSLGRRIDTQFADYSENFVNIGFGFNGGRKWIKASPGNY